MEQVGGKPWEEFLGERPLGVVATNGPGGTPHAVPVEVVVREGFVYVWCGASSAKARNAVRDPRVALVAYKGNDGVLVRGTARLIAQGEDGYAAITQGFLEKYNRHEAYGNDTLIQIAPERVTTFS
ncbi:MAG: pyridoxamine 5'-phosphate oxidase family protein [Actinomycetota bacterium]